jgi:hypothetical protein
MKSADFPLFYATRPDQRDERPFIGRAARPVRAGSGGGLRGLPGIGKIFW